MLCDYRSLPVPAESEKYDKVISIEMLEAVGAEFLTTYFRCIDQLLKSGGGVAVFQCITMPESRYKTYSSSDDFIRRYIFPGGHLPTITQLLDAIRTGSTNAKAGTEPRLIPESIENIGPHYAKTLRLWRQTFMQQFSTKIRPALFAEHAAGSRAGKKMNEEDVEVFKRKWEYYFAYCEAGFATKTLGDVIITVGREGAVEMMEDVPL
jgi:cyclopropane-fatty-acyl-phospholipid synthase